MLLSYRQTACSCQFPLPVAIPNNTPMIHRNIRNVMIVCF